ncbi:hypothetical protein [Paraburkholderia lacunae]|uniref:Uncharacterized protein n=1 Tax=Paraburkholderia lacunae TaxID=2211104 RepID=A0A370MY63_9BURK|nr:hypothetical protein [Paraburkholderia lacunae]RDJ98321.1 hypothetical protein DLM46_33980 [Paraburkholderia lacunae]
MSVLSKPVAASRRKRFAGALIAASFCALIGACSNDDKAPGTSTASSSSTADQSGNTAQVLSANPSSASPAAPALTIQTPARLAAGADTALSAAASAPLATPVIHTVD